MTGEQQDIKNILNNLCRQKNWQHKLSRHQVFLIWDEIVGADIADHAEPQVIRGGVLWVAVSDPVWMQQLQFLKKELLERLNEHLIQSARQNALDIEKVKLSDIRFQLAKATNFENTKQDERVSLTSKQPSSSAKIAFENMIAHVKDNAVKESLRKIWLANQPKE